MWDGRLTNSCISVLRFQHQTISIFADYEMEFLSSDEKLQIFFFFFLSRKFQCVKIELLKCVPFYANSNQNRDKSEDVKEAYLMIILQGPVVQSVVSLTSSLRVISLTVLADSIHNILIFFAEKM